ncbi:Inactive phospholipase C-like protein 1 [Galemys pyrenaicus]|uniref:Inactive phospholipase C-like protein 1 n=1 Tax=Galemys pyrenaicus TaxID=202257 RepID=A0A8J6AHN5_GALPY|nr:Inactive phospholipase C-like protein 1 [Galemys pyrenaicus]
MLADAQTRARAHTLSSTRALLDQASSYRMHSILLDRAHPFRVGIGRVNSPSRLERTPKRLRRLPIPTGCQNKSSLPVTTERSGGRPPPPPHFLRLLSRCPRAGGGKLPPLLPPPGSETKSGGAASWCMSAPVSSVWTPLAGVQFPPGEPETRWAMAEGAAGREGPAQPDAAGGEDDSRVGLDLASGDSVAAVPGGRSRDRRSGVALQGAAGAPADSEAGLLEAARATPRRSSIIKVSQAAQPLGTCMPVVGGSGTPAGCVVSGGVAGSALFSPTFIIKPSFLVWRFPVSALGREKQK